MKMQQKDCESIINYDNNIKSWKMIYLLNPPPPQQFKISRIGRCITKTKADYVYPPTELLYIAALLRKHKFDIGVVDGALLDSAEEVFKSLHNPEFVIIIVGIFSYTYDAQFMRHLKTLFPSTKIIVFGQGASFLTDFYLDVCDYVIYGEPEQAILQAVNGEKNVKGVSCWDNGSKVINKTPNYIENLDDLPHPARDLIDNSVYRHAFLRPYAMVYSSRGCPYVCNFCTTKSYSPKFRKRSVENVIEELTELKEKFGVQSFGFIDDTFLLSKKRATDISEAMISQKLNMTWIALGRVDCMDADVLRAMKAAGCKTILYGMESFDQKVLDYMKKDCTVEQIENAVHETKKAGIEVHGFFNFGSRVDTVESIKHTIHKTEKLGLDYASFNVFVPYPGTDSYDELKKDNLILTEEWTRYDQSGGFVFKHPTISDCDMAKLIKYAYFRFYFNKNFIFRRLKKDFTSFTLLKRDFQNMFKIANNYLLKSDA
ncbi:MAG: radical SAM protein [Deltaproteobacteria bacterium]|nr:radical SAM protein [Deltaproteobacteria bacterium]